MESPKTSIKNPFRSKMMVDAFDGGVLMFVNRHKTLFASTTGEPHRLNGLASPFWRGYFNEKQLLIEKGTPSYAMFKAGQACRKEFDVKFPHDGKFIPMGAEHHYPKQA